MKQTAPPKAIKSQDLHTIWILLKCFSFFNQLQILE